MPAVSCGYALQCIKVGCSYWFMSTWLFFSGQHVKLAMHCLFVWALLQLQWISGPFWPMQRRILCCKWTSGVHKMPFWFVLQCVWAACAQWQLLCRHFLC